MALEANVGLLVGRGHFLSRRKPVEIQRGAGVFFPGRAEGRGKIDQESKCGVTESALAYNYVGSVSCEGQPFIGSLPVW